MFLVDIITHNTTSALLLLLMIFARFLGAISVHPMFSSSILSSLLRNSLSLMLAILIFPYLRINTSLSLSHPFGTILLIAGNYCYGYLIGFFLSFPIWLIESCGNIIDTQRGEQAGAIMNKLTSNPASSIASLLTKAFIVYFVMNNGLIFFLGTLFKSFSIIPVDNLWAALTQMHVNDYTHAVSQYFYWVIVLVLPIILALFLLDLILGLIGAFIPQMNVTVIAMPIKSALALFLLTMMCGYIFHNILVKFLMPITM